MAKVVAKERGHDGVQIREEGETFDVPDSRLSDGSTWFEVVDPADKARAAEAEAGLL